MHRLFSSPDPCENWFLSLDLLENESALLLGFELPSEGPAERRQSSSSARLWAAYHGTEHIHWLEDRFQTADFRRSSKFFFVQLGKSWLRQQATLGEIRSRDAHWRWDIDIEEAEPMLDYPPLFRPLKPQARRGLYLLSDRVNLRASGQLSGPENCNFEYEPATLIRQGWKGHQWRGFWAHCNSCLEDDLAVIEIYCDPGARFKSGHLLVFVESRGQRYWFRGDPAHIQGKRGNAQDTAQAGPWSFTLSDGENSLRGEFWPPERLLQIESAGLFWGKASLSLQLQRRGRAVQALSAGDSVSFMQGMGV